MAINNYQQVAAEGLWHNNPALVQLLGLCPLLAVTNTLVNGIGMGLATLFVLTTSNLAVAASRQFITPAVRLPIFVLIIASSVTVIELLMQAYAYPLYQILGIFLPLITTNCVILGRAEAYASKQSLLPATWDGFMMGLGFAWVLMLLGAIREFVGTGILFSNMHLLFGETARNWHWVIIEDHPQLLLSLLPPGAFIFAGFLMALKNSIDAKLKDYQAKHALNEEKTSRRIRVTAQ